MSDASLPGSGRIIYRRLLGYVRPHWKIFLVSILTMAVYAATDTGFAAIMQPMLDGSFVDRDPAVIRMIPLALIGLFLLRGVTGFLSNYSMNWVGRQVIQALRGEIFSHYLRLPSAYFDSRTTGQLVSLLTFNVERVAQASTNAITIIVRDTLTALFLLGWMVWISGYLALLFLVLGPVISLLVRYISKRFRRISTRLQNSMGDVTHITEEIIDGQQVVKTFGGQAYEEANFHRINEGNRRLNMKMTATSAASVPIVQFIAACTLAGVVYLATRESMLNELSVGTFVSFITAMLLLLPPLKRLTTVTSSLQSGIAAADSLFEVLDTAPESDTGSLSLARATGAVQYRGVSFHYGDDSRPVLQDIDLDIHAGETVALVGRSGSGKSTLATLLPRFYDPQAGSIQIDGHDIRDYRLADLRQQIALVGQQVTLFNTTVRNNIAYGRLGETSEAAIIAAAEAAHAMEFIADLPAGLDTEVGENGVLLSGGQRQRLAIARALLKDAPILILDEATSSLDTESEQAIQQGLEQLMRNRTTLVIAHRLSTIEKADRILVLHEGRIIEQGRHAELLAHNGHYAALHRMQFHDAPEPA